MKNSKRQITTILIFIFCIVFQDARCQKVPISEINMSKRYQISRTGSYISMTMDFNGIPVIKGSIENYQGTIFYDEDKPEASSATFRFKSPTISTAHEARNKSLMSESFLDIEAFPEIWFQSTSTSVTQDDIVLKGNLIIKDISKPVTVNIKKPKVIPHMEGSLDYMLVQGNLKLDRTDFGLGKGDNPWNQPGIDGNPQLSYKIEVEFYFTCYSYNLDYLKSIFSVKQQDGSDNPVGKVYEIIKTEGFKKGIKSVDKMKKKDITAKLYANLGWILMSDGSADEAIDMYERGLDIDPTSKSNRLRIGDAYVIGGYLEKAVAHYSKEQPLNPALTHMPEMLKLLNGTLMNKSSIETR